MGDDDSQKSSTGRTALVTEAQRFVTTEALKQSVQASSMLFLGERHDHRIITGFRPGFWRFVAPKSTIAFEMLDEEDDASGG